MRQLNFVLIFVACLAAALFAMQNSAVVTVNVAPGMTFEAPLVVELLMALGIGAGVAWMFNLWGKTQSVVEFRKQTEALQDRDSRIAELNDLVVSLESTVAQLPPSKSADPTNETIEAQSEEDKIRDIEQEAAERLMS